MESIRRLNNLILSELYPFTIQRKIAPDLSSPGFIGIESLPLSKEYGKIVDGIGKGGDGV
jgi:hypothetical protein